MQHVLLTVKDGCTATGSHTTPIERWNFMLSHARYRFAEHSTSGLPSLPEGVTILYVVYGMPDVGS